MRSLFFRSLPVLFAIAFSGCTKSGGGGNNSAPADPAGTNVVNLLTGTSIVLDDSVNAFAQSGYGALLTTYKNSLILSLDANLNLDLSYAAGINPSYGLNYTLGCSDGIINLGSVSGLGSITTHPTSGYSSTSLAQVGVGYIVESVDNNPDGSHTNGTSPTYTSVPRTLYYRIYVTTTVLNTSNGIAGYTIKYQGPF